MLSLNLLLQAMLSSQDRLRGIIKDFRFNLGFSGYYFHHGLPEEDEGDDMLIG
jgi:heparan sulfate N-deacetylase/N-sulfotransferase NDST2